MADTDFTLTKDYLHQIFEYKDGNLYYKKQTSPNSKIGKKVGSLTNRGYLSTTIKSKFYLLHRLIFMMFHGYLPAYIDHIDGNQSNNCIENLREATLQQNNYNAKTRKNSKSGIKNVYWQKSTKKWGVALRTNKIYKYFGCFDDLELATLVATEARNKYHGKFAKHN